LTTFSSETFKWKTQRQSGRDGYRTPLRPADRRNGPPILALDLKENKAWLCPWAQALSWPGSL
jgi:hypothetical protein